MDEHRCIFAQKEKNIWSIFNNWSLLWSRSKWIQGVSCVYRHNSSWTNMCIFKLLCEAFVMFHTLSQLSYTVHVISFSNDSFTHHFLFIYFHVPPQTTHFHVLFIHMKFFTLIYFHTRFSPAGSFNIIFDSPPMNHLFTWDCFFSCDFFYRLLIYFNVIFFPGD